MVRRSYVATLLAIAFLLPMTLQAEGFAALKGVWSCQENGTRSTLEFQSANQLIYNGTAARYQISGSMLSVEEESGIAYYHYTFQGGRLVILSFDGSVTNCERGGKPVQQAQPFSPPGQTPQTQQYGGSSAWPPPYARPSGRSSWDSSSPQHLLYKFAGRWDHYSGSTLINLYLKPDGTYEDSSETSYSGEFTDQYGHQTGAWGAVGTGQGQGRWTIRGTLRQGSITLIAPNGSQRTINYQVYCRGGECYGSDYYFNGSLYRVKYIYR